MRLKGINPFELHVEKAVVGAVAAAALGILAWQFVGPPNRVMVDNKPVGIDEAYPLLAGKAENVLRQVRNPAPEFADIPQLDMLARWEARMSSAHTRSSPLAWPVGGGAVVVQNDPTIPSLGELRVAEQVAPAPTTPIAATYLATIAPEDVSAYPELAKLLPPSMPFDHAAVSVETSFSGTALRAMLASDPDGDGPLSKLPEHWWSGGIQILDVKLERAEMRPDGSWGDPVLIAPIPGRDSLRADLAAAEDGAAIRKVFDEAPKLVEDICRPDYYQIVFGDPWTQPSRLAQGRVAMDRGRIDGLLRQRAHFESQIQRWEADLAKINDQDRAADAKRRNLERNISDARRQLDQNRAELIDAGHVFADQPSDAAAAAAAGGATEAPLLATEAMPIWAHDLTAQRGKTYRYRFIVALRNPLYGQRAALHRESQAFAESPVMLSRPSEWSGPVRVDPELYFFITSANDPSRDQRMATINSTPRASAEIYAFHWGYWRRATLSLEPGDPLVGELRVPDMVRIMEEAARQAEQQNNPDPPAQTERSQQTPWQRITVAQDGTFLLDVAAVPVVQGAGIGAGSGVQYRAFFRDGDGKIVVRNPETERSDPAYSRVLASAQAGEDALRPRDTQTVTPGPGRRDEPREPDGGKGGGAGGG